MLALRCGRGSISILSTYLINHVKSYNLLNFRDRIFKCVRRQLRLATGQSLIFAPVQKPPRRGPIETVSYQLPYLIKPVVCPVFGKNILHQFLDSIVFRILLRPMSPPVNANNSFRKLLYSVLFRISLRPMCPVELNNTFSSQLFDSMSNSEPCDRLDLL